MSSAKPKPLLPLKRKGQAGQTSQEIRLCNILIYGAIIIILAGRPASAY